MATWGNTSTGIIPRCIHPHMEPQPYQIANSLRARIAALQSHGTPDTPHAAKRDGSTSRCALPRDRTHTHSRPHTHTLETAHTLKTAHKNSLAPHVAGASDARAATRSCGRRRDQERDDACSTACKPTHACDVARFMARAGSLSVHAARPVAQIHAARAHDEHDALVQTGQLQSPSGTASSAGVRQ